MKLLWLFLLKLLTFLPMVSGDGRCLTTFPEVNPKKYFHMNQKSLNITLETSDRITHQLSTHVFQIFIREIVGYAKVQIKHKSDNFQLENVIERLSDQQTLIPSSTINVEVWIPPDYDTYATEIVKECGSVSPPGRFGWFIPMHLQKPIRHIYNPSGDPDIKSMHWRFFRDREVVQLFDIDASTLKKYIEDKNYNRISPNSSEYLCNESFCKNGMYVPKQCEKENCAVLLTAGYFETNFVINHIDEDKLFVKVLWLGSNLKKVVKELSKSRAYEDQRKSLVMLHWTPSDLILHDRDFITIMFENSEHMNFTHIDTVGYKYEMHRLVKMAWNKVEKFAKPLYDALRNFKFEEEDFSDLLELYENNYEHRSINEIACEWMRTKSRTWMKWKKSSELTTKIYIGGIFPMSGSSYTGGGIVRGAQMAMNAINSNSTILSDYKLDILVVDGECSADTVMKKFIDFIVEGYYPNLVGVLGPACSDTVEPLAGVSKHYRIMVISYSAEGASFSNRDKYPYFFRTIGENKHYIHVYLKLLQYFKWKRVAALTEDGQKYTEYISLMQNDFEKHKINFIMNKKFPREREREPMTTYLQDLKNKRARIIIADVVDEVARQVMCEAYKLKMTAAQGYVWFLPMWLGRSWYNTDYFNGMMSKTDYTKTENVSCTTSEMIKAITGYFSMTHAYFNYDSAIMQEGITVGEWRKNYQKFSRGITSDYAGFAYDAVWTYAFALDKLGKTDPEALSDLHSDNTTNKLVKLVEQTDFYGVSGRIKFRGGPSRFSVINILQWYDNETHVVGYFNPLLNDKPEILGGNLSLNSSAVRWFTPDRKKPDDGTLPLPTCGFQLIADAFNVECQTAIVIFNVLLLSFLIITVCAVCLYVKVKYNKRVKRQKEYMEKLGLRYEKKADPMDLDKYEIPRDRIYLNRSSKLGEGAFGVVIIANVSLPGIGKMAVAVKTLHMHASDEDRIDFLTEAENMRRFDHKNIVKLIGVVTSSEPLHTLMEFVMNGDLRQFLHRRKYLFNTSAPVAEEVNPKKLTNFAMDIARGLSYLVQEKFIHRDLACRNCLLSEYGIVKIGDFGMARPMNDNNYYQDLKKGKLPVRWMAPESITKSIYSADSDIWSYGVVIYEIITFSDEPFEGKSNEEVSEMVEKGATLEIPKEAKPELAALLKYCWAWDPKDRPAASEIVEFLANKSTLLTPCLEKLFKSTYVNESHLDWGSYLQRHMRQRRPLPSNGISYSPSKLWRSKEDPEVNVPLENCEPLLGFSRSATSLVSLNRYVSYPNTRPDLLSQEDEERIISPHTPNGDICCSSEFCNSEV